MYNPKMGLPKVWGDEDITVVVGPTGTIRMWAGQTLIGFIEKLTLTATMEGTSFEVGFPTAVQGDESIEGYRDKLTEFPQVSVAQSASVEPSGWVRKTTGIETLDTLLEGGFPCGVMTLIEGPSSEAVLELLKDAQAILIPENTEVTPKEHAARAKVSNDPYVVYTADHGDPDSEDSTLPKELKYRAFVRLRLKDGQIKVIKDMTAATSGHSVMV